MLPYKNCECVPRDHLSTYLEITPIVFCELYSLVRVFRIVTLQLKSMYVYSEVRPTELNESYSQVKAYRIIALGCSPKQLSSTGILLATLGYVFHSAVVWGFGQQWNHPQN